MDKTPTEWMMEPLRRYTQFSGRARRAEYWWFILLCTILSLIGVFLDRITGIKMFGLIVSLALFIPNLSVSFRRMHDINRSGWWQAVGFIGSTVLTVGLLLIGYGGRPNAILAVLVLLGLLLLLAYSILLLVWLCQRGTVGDNRFGPDPLTGVASGRS